MRNHRRRRVSWSELPPELLIDIAERLETRADNLNFRRVCKTWRSSAPLSLLTPKNILSTLFPLFPEAKTRFRKVLVTNSVFLVQSAINPKLPPWLLTVEEFTPGRLSIRCPLSRCVVGSKNLPEHFSYNLELSKFHVSELGRFLSYTIVDDNARVSSTSFDSHSKVVLFVNPNCVTSSPTIHDCSVVELSDRVPLTVKRLLNEDKYTEQRAVYFRGRKLDDIVGFKGKIYGIDRKGRVCSMDYDSLKMSSVAEDPLCEGSGSDNKKRLVVWCDELYLVYTIWGRNDFPSCFKVFMLNEEEGKWDRLERGIGNDRILFVTFDGCFFAEAKDFPRWRGNCIVSPEGSFPRYSKDRFVDLGIFNGELDYIVVYHFEGGQCDSLDCYPSYSKVLWPPPTWLWTDACLTTCESDSEEEETRKEDDDEGEEAKREEDDVEGEEEKEDDDDGDEDDREKLQSGSPSHFAPDLIFEEGISPNYVQVAKGIQIVQEGVAHEEFKNQDNVDSAPAKNSPLKISEKNVSQLKFVGVDVGSHLVPILEKIWAKHGNITDGHVVTSDGLLNWGLESLANMIIILQSNSGRSLDDSQAQYLKSTLPVLRLMQFKLDWLVPFVEKALADHKNKVITELEMAKSKLQTELREVGEKLAEQGKPIPESQLMSASLDLNDVLS